MMYLNYALDIYVIVFISWYYSIVSDSYLILFIAACEDITKIATHINECVRQHENFHKMLAIQNSFVGEAAPKILTPGKVSLLYNVIQHI